MKSAELSFFASGNRVLCALSGGADSVALTLFLCENAEKLGISIGAAHFNHRLRGAEADRDENFCFELCKRLNIPFYRGEAQVGEFATNHGLGVEEAARQLRYEFLEKISAENSYDLVATAHNAEDNAETVLFHLIRGTGLTGLCGIPPQRGIFVRPLLSVTRRAIEAYLAEHQQEYVTDSTNLKDDYARNRLRHAVLPVLCEMNPRFPEAVASMTRLLREDEALLTTLARSEKPKELSVAVLTGQPFAVASRSVRELAGSGLTRTHVEQILALTTGGPSGRVSLPGGRLAVREYDRIFIQEAAGEISIPTQQPLKPGKNLYGEYIVTVLPGYSRKKQDICVDSSLLPQLVLRPRQEGDRISPVGRDWTKTLKKLYIELKIPTARRAGYPVIACGDKVCALPGTGVDKRFAPTGQDTLIITVSEK